MTVKGKGFLTLKLTPRPVFDPNMQIQAFTLGYLDADNRFVFRNITETGLSEVIPVEEKHGRPRKLTDQSVVMIFSETDLNKPKTPHLVMAVMRRPIVNQKPVSVAAHLHELSTDPSKVAAYLSFLNEIVLLKKQRATQHWERDVSPNLPTLMSHK